MRFARRRHGLELRLSGDEARLLTSLANDLAELVAAPQEHGGPVDPLEAVVGLSSTPLDRPDDPALARLLPDAYGTDPAAAADFRRYTEGELRAGKRAHAEAVVGQLEPVLRHGGRLPLDREQADAWLGLLNDLRLVLGTRLQVSDDGPDPEDLADPAVNLYGWLGYQQESLLAVLPPRVPGAEPT